MSPRVDVVIPIYNAEAHLRSSLEKLKELQDLTKIIVCVNDASTDNTQECLRTHAQNLIVITNSTNVGQHESTRTGMKHCTGEWVLTIDDDFPLSTEEIRRFILEGLKEGSSLTYAQYKQKMGKIRLFGSRVTNRIMKHRYGLTGQGSSTRLIHRTLLDRINGMNNPSAFLDTDLLSQAEVVSFVEVTPDGATHVRSRYSYYRLFTHFIKMLFGR